MMTTQNPAGGNGARPAHNRVGSLTGSGLTRPQQVSTKGAG